jgi:hypothetical protein
MTPTSSSFLPSQIYTLSTASWRLGLSPFISSDSLSMERLQQRKITRNREFRACTSCRKSKLKCDRQVPCSACLRRNEATSCFYEKKFEGGQNEHARRLQTEAKLEHLEQLVQQLSQSQHSLAAPDNTSLDANQRSPDQLFNGSLHNGATHWSAMLEDIEDLRATMNARDDIEGGDMDFDSDEDNGISLLFGAANPLPFNQILSQFLPSRNEADRLVAAYFRAKAVAAPFIHSAQFSRLYRLFWDDPSTTSPLWTSILFLVLDIASRTVSTISVANTGVNNTNRFAMGAALCLAVGKYSKPQRFTVEALLLYAQARCILSVDISPEIAVILGMLVRLATVMGYHRDAGSREYAPPFDAEMRRRTWSLCMQLDLLVSFQLGLPSNVQSPTWDTKPPTNLLDSDFDEDTVQLPPPRPIFEPTEIVFYIAKHKLMAAFEKIMRHTLSPPEGSAYELQAIDAELRNTYRDLPPVFHAQFMTDSVVTTPSLIVTRLCVNAIYQKCLCVLHRQYVMEGRTESIQTCYDAATDIVRRLVDIYQEFGPGGQLESERWFRGSITWHDFLLGCTALCLTVCSTRHHIAGPSRTEIVNTVASLELLSSANVVINQHTPSRGSRKVRWLIEAVIREFGGQRNGSPEMVQTPFDSGRSLGLSPTFQGVRSPQRNNDEIDWLWGETTMTPMEDPAWTYMQQFLDLPNEDIIFET